MLAGVAAAPPALAGGLRIGVGGHDAWTTDTYRQADPEAVFAFLAANGFTSYRVDVEANERGRATLARLVALGRRHGIVIRPMLYVDGITTETVARLATEFAGDITLWELGNELNLRGADRFAESIGLMTAARLGIERAAAATGQPLKTALNVTAFAGTGNEGLNPEKTSYPFVDQALAMGLSFDVITFHYYPHAGDRAGGWIRTYLEPLRRYGKPVVYNELNCAEIYRGDDGNSPACAGTVSGLLEEIEGRYADLVREVIFYQLYDDPHAETGPERHFGILFGFGRPKRTFTVARAYALRRRTGDAR